MFFDKLRLNLITHNLIFRELVKAEKNKKINKRRVNIAAGVVFSFNRPMQLHLLLNSYFRLVSNPAPIVVQYKATGDEYEKAYMQVFELFPDVSYVRETDFRSDLLRILEGLDASKIFFLVDDIVFTRPFDMKVLSSIDLKKYVPAIRLGENIDYSYTSNIVTTPPPFLERQDGMLEFDWGIGKSHWNYPMSVDGNFFDIDEILVMSRVLGFKAPNSYEAALKKFARIFRRRKGICFRQPPLFNIPCNRVQDELANRSGDVSAEMLLLRWQSGECIDPEPLERYDNRSPHTEVDFRFMPLSD